MKKHKMTQEDIEQIQTLENIVKKIEEIYRILYKLEIANKKDSTEYFIILEKLNNYIILEEEHYKYCNLTFAKIEAWKKYILENKVTYKFNQFAIDSIINEDYEELPFKRIIQTLSLKLNQTEDAELFYKNLGFIDPNIDGKNIVEFTHQLINNVEQDTIKIYLYLLENNPYIQKNDKINHKYNLCFTNKALENDLLENRFEIKKDVFITSKLIADANYLATNDYEYIKDEYAKQNVSIQILELLQLKNNKHNNKAFKNILCFKELFLRANLCMLSDNELELIHNIYNNILNNNTTNSQKSEKLISKCFEKIKEDKSIKLTLSFKNN